MDPAVTFLAGDVMTGRGVDQILRRPGSPVLRESYVTDAPGNCAEAWRSRRDEVNDPSARWSEVGVDVASSPVRSPRVCLRAARKAFRRAT